MVSVSKKQVENLLRMTLLAQSSGVGDKIAWFEKKYPQGFAALESALQSEPENFVRWDDYMEWKAYRNVHDELQHDLSELRHGHFEIA